MKPSGLSVLGMFSDLQVGKHAFVFLHVATQSWSDIMVGPAIMLALKTQICPNWFINLSIKERFEHHANFTLAYV